jgi:hypothetical protein
LSNTPLKRQTTFGLLDFLAAVQKSKTRRPADGERLRVPDGWRVGDVRIVKERS